MSGEVLTQGIAALGALSYRLGLYTGTLIKLRPSVLPGVERRHLDTVIAHLVDCAEHLQRASNALKRARDKVGD
jgi:hypothetical protein